MVSEVNVEGEGFSALRGSPSGNERVVVSKPCLFAFDKAATELRRPNVKGIMMAKKVIETVSHGDLGVDIGESGIKIHDMIRHRRSLLGKIRGLSRSQLLSRSSAKRRM